MTNWSSAKKIASVAIIIVFACVSTAHAQLGLDKAQGVATSQGLYDKDVFALIGSVVLWLMSFAAILALIALIYAGVLYIVDLGEDDRAEKAKKIALYAVIGLILIGASFLILNVVRFIFT